MEDSYYDQVSCFVSTVITIKLKKNFIYYNLFIKFVEIRGVKYLNLLGYSSLVFVGWARFIHLKIEIQS
jgi:hypothetical protein